MSKNDYKILMTLQENSCTTEYLSMTMEQLIAKTDLSYNKIRYSMRMFCAMELVGEGAVDGKAKTYFITQAGIKKIKSLQGE